MQTMRCDECGYETSGKLSNWFRVARYGMTFEGEPYSRHFCSEVCVASFYQRRTQELIGRPPMCPTASGVRG